MIASRPRVLVVTPWFPSLKEPGAGSFVQRDVELLSRFVDVTVVHLGAPQFFGADLNIEDQYEDYRVIRIPFSLVKYGQWIQAARTIRRELKRADVLHTMSYHALPPMTLLKVDKPWIHTEHFSGLLSAPTGNSRSVWLQKRVREQLRRPDRMVAVSTYLAVALKAYRRDQIGIIGNAVPVGRPHVLDAETWLFSEVNLVSGWSDSRSQGARAAVETLIELNERGVKATLTWVGTGPLQAELEKKAAQYDLEKQLKFVGAVTPERVGDYLDAANVFLLPTRSETFGVALAEAYASGLPIVTGDRGGFTDFLDEESTVQVPTDDFSGTNLANAVELVISRSNLPSRAEIARRAAEAFDENQRLEEYSRLYSSLGLTIRTESTTVRQIQCRSTEAHPSMARPLDGKKIAYLLRGVIANDARVHRTAKAAKNAGAETRVFYRPGVTGVEGSVPEALRNEVTDMSEWNLPLRQRNLDTGKYEWKNLNRRPLLVFLDRVPKVGTSFANYFAERGLARKLRNEVANYAPDLVHAHDANTLTLARLSSRGNAPFVYDAHEMWRGNYQKPHPWYMRGYMRFFEAKALRKSAGLITVSNSIMRWMRREYEYVKPTAVVRNVPERATESAFQNARHIRKELGLDDEAKILLYGGAVLPYRGIEQAIEALALVPEQTNLVVVGYGQSSYLSTLKELASNNGVRDRVWFFGAVPHTQLVGTVAQADISLVCIQAISPSFRFSLPNKLFEAIQANTPVIASDIPDLKALVTETGVGKVVSGWTAEQLAKTVIEILQNADHIKEKLLNVASSLNWETESKVLIRFYTDILN